MSLTELQKEVYRRIETERPKGNDTVSNILALIEQGVKPNTQIFTLSRNAQYYCVEFDRIIASRDDRRDFKHLSRSMHLHIPSQTKWTYVADPFKLRGYGDYIFGFLPTGHMHLKKHEFKQRIEEDLISHHCRALVSFDDIYNREDALRWDKGVVL